MDYKKLKKLADDNGLEFVETVPTPNDYPKHQVGAVLGFKSWEQAEELSKKTGLPLELVTKRDGWKHWYRPGKPASEPLLVIESDYGMDCVFYDQRHKEGFYENEVEPFLDGLEEQDKQTFINQMKTIKNALDGIGETEAVVTLNGEVVEVINTRPMWCHIDTKFYAIALMGYEQV